MNLKERVSTFLTNECMLEDMVQVQTYVMNRKKQILDNHYTCVCRLYEPGEGGQKYYMTKLTPQNRNHSGKIYAKSKEALDEKIIAYYLGIKEDEKNTVRDTLVNALGGDIDNLTKTAKRTLQRFDKNLSSLTSLRFSQLNETSIRSALDQFVQNKPSEKEFNETITALNKIADYCNYEHINSCNIREIISLYRKIKLNGKHIWAVQKKKTLDLAFTRAEASKIVQHALSNPNYKSLSVALLITTGLRAGELLGLELKDIYLEDGYLWIHQIEDTKTYELLNYVKENKSREVFLSDEAIRVIKKCLQYRNNDSDNSPFLLLNPNSKDGKMHIRAIDDYLRVFVHQKLLGYNERKEARSPHDCRRTYASLEYLNGTSVDVLMSQLGHANVGQTWDYIKNVVDASERRSQLKGAGLLLEAEKQPETPNNTVDALWTQNKQNKKAQ